MKYLRQSLFSILFNFFFGEWRFVITIGILVLLVGLVLYGLAAIVFAHFIIKYW